MVLNSVSYNMYGVLQVVWGSMCSCTEYYEVVSTRNSSL